MDSVTKRNHRCARCRCVLGSEAMCRVVERPCVTIDRRGKVNRGVEMLVVAYCDACAEC